jgi:hypothetical protein
MNFRLLRSLSFVTLACSSIAPFAHAATTAPSLAPYYSYYPAPSSPTAVDPPILGFPPTVRVIGGGVDPAPIVTSAGSFASIQRMLIALPVAFYGISARQYLFERRDGVCQDGRFSSPAGPATAPIPRISGEQYTITVTVDLPERGSCPTDFFGGQPGRWSTTDRVTFLAPIRRTAIDGSEYDASPTVLERGGQPWMTYYAGYRLGFVAGESNWVTGNEAKLPELAGWPSFPNARDNFELVKLPPPFVEGEVVEYFVYDKDVQGAIAGRFGYAATTDEQKVFDASAAWIRTGQSFRSGGYVAVCSVATGVALDTSTRLYSANAKECAALAASPVFPVMGTPIRASRLIPAATPGVADICPAAAVPLYRLFNNGFGAGKGIGHRFLTSNAVRQEMVRAGWIDDGAVMCVPQ